MIPVDVPVGAVIIQQGDIGDRRHRNPGAAALWLTPRPQAAHDPPRLGLRAVIEYGT
jgi:hypothetical protein